MASWTPNNTIVTRLGNSLIAQAKVGIGKIKISRVISRENFDANGASAFKEYTMSNISEDSIAQTGIITKVESVSYEDEEASVLSVRFSNEDLSEDYTYNLRQIIVIAQLEKSDGTLTEEIPYYIAQCLNSSEPDVIPKRSENPTSLDYDIYLLHSGVPNITYSLRTEGYVYKSQYDSDITQIHTLIDTLSSSDVGKNTQDTTFQVWSPQYSDDDDPTGGRVWSKVSDESGTPVTTEFTGQKSAERFNMYDENANVAVGKNSHVEGEQNVGITSCCHIEGIENHSGTDNNFGIHIEGRRNYATLGWFQHVEGEGNQSAGYVTHMEGASNKALNTESEEVGFLHVEGTWNTVKNGKCHHVEGQNNTIEQGFTHHVEGKNNTVEQGNYHHIEGYSNTVTGVNDCNHVGGQLNKVNNCGESNVSGKENTITDSNQITVSGHKNTVSSSEMASVSGLNNTVSSSPRASVSGTNNTVTSSRGTNVSGDSNKVIEDCFESIVSGYYNSLTRSEHTLISGHNNTVSDSDNSIYSGTSNKSSASVSESIVLGNSNSISNSLRESSGNMILSGIYNTVIDSSESYINGYSNNVNYAVHSIVSGNSNNIVVDPDTSSKHVEDCVISGYSNTVERTVRSFITGISNTVTDYKPNGVAGERSMSVNNTISGNSNSLNGIFSSVVTGKSNTVTNIHDSLIGGRNNTVTSEVQDTDTNCVLCSGLNCTVENIGSPVFVTGSFNSVSGSNTSVMGSNNVSSSNDQLVTGHYNSADTTNKYAVIVGGGTSNLNRNNIMTLDWSGVLNVTDLVLGDSNSSVSARLTALENQVKQLLSASGT